MKGIFIIFLLPVFAVNAQQTPNAIEAAKNLITRVLGTAVSDQIKFEPLFVQDSMPAYEYEVDKNKLVVKGNSVVALCHGFYDYLKTSDQGMITWSGQNLQFATPWKHIEPKRVVSPYRYHYYINVVMSGYTTPYWDWNRWQRELDWMALHGMDMPMLNNAYEAIMYRVYRKIGLSEKEISNFFTGPAFQPWNRMGNISGWDGPAPASWYTKQIALTHKILDRMQTLGMTPIIQAFAGFVPKEITKIYPSAKLTPLVWNKSFPEQNRCDILLPDSTNAKLFKRIGKLFVQEWEKEFGKGKYYLADCFNEMHVPKPDNASETDIQNQLSQYGNVLYQSLREGNDSAVWVMQGWTFGYQRSEWNTPRLSSLVSKAPDNKVLILDYANDYNIDYWYLSENWKYFDGFFNKSWVYGFMPNAGGKIPWTGVLKTYAHAPIFALNYAGKGNLIGFGFAPEGIENNELVYELLSDMGWRDKEIDINSWLKNYCIQRFGSYPDEMKMAYQCFLGSCYGSFKDHPKFNYQSEPKSKNNNIVNNSQQFLKGVRLFLDCADALKGSGLYRNDAIELAAQYLSVVSDSLVKQALGQTGAIRYKQLNEAYSLLDDADKLLESHPNDRLEKWVNYAKWFGDNVDEQNYYMQDARRIITTWGPGVNDYATRMWGGVISSYYVQRMKLTYEAERDNKKFDVGSWEENWIKNGPSPSQQFKPFKNPVAEAKRIIDRLNR